MSASAPNARKRRFLILLTVVLVTVTVEGLARILGSTLVIPRLSFVFLQFDAHTLRNGYSAYLDDRDPVLGWPTKTALKTDAYGPGGARPSPSFLEPTAPCVTLFGDSFTYASEVDDEHAWGEVLARQLNCRVANYGVGGYGCAKDNSIYTGRRKSILARQTLEPVQNGRRRRFRSRRHLEGQYISSFLRQNKVGECAAGINR